jgi:two-component system CheB/CheR fusion protein
MARLSILFGERRQILEAAKHILLVDDEADFLFSASLALRKAGFLVKVADNGREALIMILEAHKNKDPFDLLITDIRMPGMSGFDLIDATKRCGILTPFFAMTCFSKSDQLREMNDRGCEGVIEKPFSPEELVERIREILDSLRQAVS